MDLREHVEAYKDLGWVIFPTGKGSRGPKQDDWPEAESPTNWRSYSNGIFLVCGERSGVSAIDLDDTSYFDRFGSLLVDNPTPYARTPGGGAHILCQYSAAEWWTNRVGIAPAVDLRNNRGGIVLPDGQAEGRNWAPGYAPWETELSVPEPYETLLEELSNIVDGRLPAGDSTLASLLAEDIGPGQRNDWLTKVAGHLAAIVPWEDGWLQLVLAVNRGLDDPLPDAEVESTVGKLYRRDRSKSPIDPHTDQVPVEYDDGNIYIWTGHGNSRKRQLWFEPEFSVRQRLINLDQGESWILANGERECRVHPGNIYNYQKLAATLGNIGVLMYPRAAGSDNAILLHRLLQQTLTNTVREAPHWGWVPELEEWVGIGDAVGPDGYKPVIGDLDRPDIIEQLPSWQEDELAAVFCSWIALQAVKGYVNLAFQPNVVLQGPAGAGKTRGLFAFGARLTGSERIASGTIASLRDRLSYHANGVVVIDDHASMEASSARLLELFRVSTSGEALTLKKQGADGWGEIRIPLRASMLVSGESLSNLSTDRALRDRSVIMEVVPASQRRSLNGDYPQWEDVQAVFEELGGSDETVAHQLAGPFIRRIMAAATSIGTPVIGDGERVAVKIALIEYGAQLWQQAYPGSRTYSGLTVPDAVARWADSQSHVSGWQDTTLIQRILPSIVDPDLGEWSTIKILDDGSVVFHLERVSRWFCDRYRDARDQEVGSVANMRRELEVLRKAGKVSRTTHRMGGSVTRVHKLDMEASMTVKGAAGVLLDDVQGEM